MKLNLGCGGKKLPNYINVDAQAEAAPDVVLDIGREVFPWPDSSIDGVLAMHIFEHLPPKEFFHCLKEIYRVCKPDAHLGVIVPHPRHDVFLNDPTHVHAITPDGMLLFSRKHAEAMRARGIEGITTYAPYIRVDFDLIEPVRKVVDPRIKEGDNWVEMERTQNNVVVEYRFTMRVVKP